MRTGRRKSLGRRLEGGPDTNALHGRLHRGERQSQHQRDVGRRVIDDEAHHEERAQGAQSSCKQDTVVCAALAHGRDGTASGDQDPDAFEDFFFKVCLLDYGKLEPAMNALKKRMDEANEVHITGPGTDLHFSIEGIPAIVCGGSHNIPDGEVFTAPVKNSINGTLSYNAPSIYQGVSFDNVRFQFKDGKIVEATANNTEKLNEILDSDAGARFIGEFAIGFNREIKHPMRDILFDEKIGGSFHFTPGQCYEQASNGNKSQIHWDLVCIQRSDYGGGEIAFDGEVIRRNGKFLPKDLKPLN